MVNFGFAVEHVLGHVTHYQNLRHWVAQDPSICPTWFPIEGGNKDIWEYMPIVRSNWSLQSSLRARDAIRAALQDQPLDALFLHTQTLALFALPIMQRIPTVISTDVTPLNYDRVGEAYKHKVGGNSLIEHQKFVWNRKTYHAADVIVAWCDWAKDSLVADYGIAADKISIIPPGIDLAQWNFENRTMANIDAKQNPVRLLFVGGDFVRKGGLTLLEAFHGGLAQDCTLDIVTKDVNIERDLAGVEGVKVHREVASNILLKELYAKADIFVFPTQADCFPMAVIEAMATGLPVITTDVGALTDEVENGVNGFIVPPRDAGAVVAAVRTLVEDESRRHTMAIASRRLVEERFDGHRNYNKILTLMKCLTER